MSGHPKGSYPATEDVRWLAFLLPGTMVCGVRGEDLIVRVGAEKADAALGEPGAWPVDLTGQPMKGCWWPPTVTLRNEDLRRWVNRDLATATSLPPT